LEFCSRDDASPIDRRTAPRAQSPPLLTNRRRAKAREQAALAAATAARKAVLDRLAWQLASLRTSLDKMAVANAAMAAELN
jgi:hypothetical protein